VSGRCKSCDNILTEIEMRYKEDGRFTELCSKCVQITYLAENNYFDDAIDDLQIDLLFSHQTKRPAHE
jgi:hypothetical protein